MCLRPQEQAGSLAACSSWGREPVPCASLGLTGTAAGGAALLHVSSFSLCGYCSGVEKGCCCAPPCSAAGGMGLDLMVPDAIEATHHRALSHHPQATCRLAQWPAKCPKPHCWTPSHHLTTDTTFGAVRASQLLGHKDRSNHQAREPIPGEGHPTSHPLTNSFCPGQFAAGLFLRIFYFFFNKQTQTSFPYLPFEKSCSCYGNGLISMGGASQCQPKLPVAPS